MDTPKAMEKNKHTNSKSGRHAGHVAAPITGCQVLVELHGHSLKNITQTHFYLLFSISGFVREPRCSNPVTWKP